MFFMEYNCKMKRRKKPILNVKSKRASVFAIQKSASSSISLGTMKSGPFTLLFGNVSTFDEVPWNNKCTSPALLQNVRVNLNASAESILKTHVDVEGIVNIHTREKYKIELQEQQNGTLLKHKPNTIDNKNKSFLPQASFQKKSLNGRATELKKRKMKKRKIKLKKALKVTFDTIKATGRFGLASVSALTSMNISWYHNR